MKPASLVGHALELFAGADSAAYPADRFSGEFFRKRSYLGSHDRRFISETVYGMIRHRRLLEALLEQFLDETPTYADLNRQDARTLSLYEILQSVCGEFRLIEGVDLPEVSAEQWTSSFPDLDQGDFQLWLTGNRDLHFLPDEKDIRLGVRYSFQDWMVAGWSEVLAHETEDLLRTLNAPAPVALRVNLLKASREVCQRRLSAEGIETEPTRYSPVGLIARRRFNVQVSPAFREGWFEIQDEGSQLVALACSAAPGMKVVDGCAGAGGKSLHLAETMRDSGEIVALDVDPARLKVLSRRAERAGFQCIETIPASDSRTSSLHGMADRVLVDAPCSGSGTIRRNPWLKWSITEDLVSQCAERQFDLISSNAAFVKPGGRLVYATCSLLRQENDDVVQRFLAAHPDFAIIPVDRILQPLGFTSECQTITLYPHRYGTDGFFISAMERALR